MKRLLVLACFFVIVSFGCKRVGEKAGESMGNFVGGMKGGVENSLEIKIEMDDDLRKKIELGEILLNSDSIGQDNKLSVYIIFNEDFDQDIRIKSFVKDKENGRVSKRVTGKKGDAAYFEFVFDPRTNIDRQYAIFQME